jgi:hypothetical protein
MVPSLTSFTKSTYVVLKVPKLRFHTEKRSRIRPKLNYVEQNQIRTKDVRPERKKISEDPSVAS